LKSEWVLGEHQALGERRCGEEHGHDAYLKPQESMRYDAEDTRGDEEQTVAFLA